MSRILFIEHSGARRELDVAEGTSVMEAAVSNLLPGIDGDCGGACACATCHVHVDAAWLPRLEPMGEHEKSMLSLAEDTDERSRLACQLKMRPELEGIVVYLPANQH